VSAILEKVLTGGRASKPLCLFHAALRYANAGRACDGTVDAAAEDLKAAARRFARKGSRQFACIVCDTPPAFRRPEEDASACTHAEHRQRFVGSAPCIEDCLHVCRDCGLVRGPGTSRAWRMPSKAEATAIVEQWIDRKSGPNYRHGFSSTARAGVAAIAAGELLEAVAVAAGELLEAVAVEMGKVQP
jgi:hypothetical protein